MVLGYTIFLLFVLAMSAVLADETRVDVSTHAYCYESGELEPEGGDRWAQSGLDTNVDWAYTNGDIVAYKLYWFGGAWSDWFVVGVNDIDDKSNSAYTLKRRWAYFADHRHKYIICQPNKVKGCQN